MHRLVLTSVSRVLLLALLGLSSGCSSEEVIEDPNAEWFGRIEAALVEAEAEGASAEQVAQLRAALDSPDGLTFADYEEAVRRGFACMEESGLIVGNTGTHTSQGVTLMDYTMAVPAGTSDALEDALFELGFECERTEFLWVARAWYEQPAVWEYLDRVTEQYKPAMIECLRRYGIEIDDDASNDELVQATNELLMSVLDSSGGPAGPDCMEETGFAEAWRG